MEDALKQSFWPTSIALVESHLRLDSGEQGYGLRWWGEGLRTSKVFTTTSSTISLSERNRYFDGMFFSAWWVAKPGLVDEHANSPLKTVLQHVVYQMRWGGISPHTTKKCLAFYCLFSLALLTRSWKGRLRRLGSTLWFLSKAAWHRRQLALWIYWAGFFGLPPQE